MMALLVMHRVFVINVDVLIMLVSLLGSDGSVGLGLRFAMNGFYGYYSCGRDGCSSTPKCPTLIQTIVAQYRVAYLVSLFDVSSAI
jgi:hypothetical protein